MAPAEPLPAASTTPAVGNVGKKEETATYSAVSVPATMSTTDNATSIAVDAQTHPLQKKELDVLLKKKNQLL